MLASFGGDGDYNGDTAEKTIVIAKAASTVNVVWADGTLTVAGSGDRFGRRCRIAGGEPR